MKPWLSICPLPPVSLEVHELCVIFALCIGNPTGCWPDCVAHEEINSIHLTDTFESTKLRMQKCTKGDCADRWPCATLMLKSVLELWQKARLVINFLFGVSFFCDRFVASHFTLIQLSSLMHVSLTSSLVRSGWRCRDPAHKPDRKATIESVATMTLVACPCLWDVHI